jgi:hypothetical protein
MESAAFKEFLGRRNRHEFLDMMLSRAIDAGGDEPSSDAGPLVALDYRQALKLCELFRVDIDGCKPDNPLRGLGDKPVASQVAKLFRRPVQQNTSLDVRFDQDLDRRDVGYVCGANGYFV